MKKLVWTQYLENKSAKWALFADLRLVGVLVKVDRDRWDAAPIAGLRLTCDSFATAVAHLEGHA